MVMMMTDLFSDRVFEVSPELETVDPGVRVPTFVYVAANEAALLWRDSIDWVRDSWVENQRVLGDASKEYVLLEISGLLKRKGGLRAGVVVRCYGCNVQWALWSDQECWRCGEVGYLYSPRNVRSLLRHPNY